MALRRFLLIFAILFLAPIIGHAATCTSTETVTKCAKIPTEINVVYESTLSDPCTFTYKDVVYSGNKPIRSDFSATCTINSPLNANVGGTAEPGVYGDILFDWSSFSFTSKLDGDICPDGFYTVPYNVSCGAGMVDTANVPNCSDDTSGESCLMPATSAPAPEYKFTATIDLSLYNDNIEGIGSPVTEFGFDLGASGTFYVDWGDGNTETINKDNTDVVTYTHDYGTTSGTYTVKIGGLATDYSDDEDTPAISFRVLVADISAYSQAITEISGSLGAIFPTLSDGSQPRFPYLFYNAGFAEIPSGLFDGIHGAPVSKMFFRAFSFNNNLTGIPENLFSGITGAADRMFEDTFIECSGLTSIPENLFAGVTGVAEGMFKRTFYGCSSLTGPSARINGMPLYELWPDNVADWGSDMYAESTGLSDYACIPTVMGGGGETCEPTPEYKFTATIDLSLYNDNIGDIWSPVTEFGFDLWAAGTFYVDWGDGTTETINRDNMDTVTYTHDYGTTSGTYTVKIGGLATDYIDNEYWHAISFGVDVGDSSAYSEAITEISGSLGAIFPTLSDGSQPRFNGTFSRANITEIPENLFSGITGNAPNMFSYTFSYSGITSIPENLFSGVTGAAEGMFSGTFRDTLITSIPENLFSGVTGAAEVMFSSTFVNTPITSIPENLFSGITDVANGMFERTFLACNMLTGPSARINGKYLYELWPDNVADWGSRMYERTTGLSDYACIPTVMGGGGEECEPASEYKFTATINASGFSFNISAAGTFYVDWGDGTTETIEKPDTTYTPYSHNYSTRGTYTVKIGGLATAYNSSRTVASISFGLDSGIESVDGSLGAIFPTLSDGSQPSFYGTFASCNYLTSIPENLFAGITGAAEYMFSGTFSATRITSIPENLFAGITGAAEGMFKSTFSDSRITSIPEKLFSGITGAAEGMFERTFEACSSLTSIPENLFSGVTGAAEGMFSGTFMGSNITSIPENLFSGITGAAEGMFFETFAYCSSLTGPSARINGKYLYELWPDNVADWGEDMYTDATGLDDYACIPTVMGGGGEECEPASEYKFTATASNTSGFSFNISAAGTFYVDWGDGTTETIEKPDTAYTKYSHNYSTAGTYTIKIGGLATAYNSSRTAASIDFGWNSDIESIDGSLGAIFPTLSDGGQPSFYRTFKWSNKLTSIPENLFSGVTGAAEGMFEETFNSCDGLTSIPENLFSGVTGAAAGMFESTFSFCLSLTSIPENLFSGVTGAADRMFSTTFRGSGITSIPENLFSGITGAAEGMFEETFYSCDGLTSIPENLFSGVTGAAEGMFKDTFHGCSSLADIPETLFSGVTGNAPYMFNYTFAACDGLTSIPENLFSGIVGRATNMFANTFRWCEGLTSIPENLFSGITGAADGMFEYTFAGTPITSIPENLFSGITNGATNMFQGTFAECFDLTGPSARINGKPLYELWPDNVATWGDGMYTNATGLSDYACIPTVMGGGGETCEPTPEYKFTATIDLSMYDDNKMGWVPVTEFGFNLGASGTFYVDWGDGNTETIKKDNTDTVTYTHDYGTTSGTYTVKIGGLATDYSDDESTPAISFEVDIGASSAYSQAITEISGSLGAIFPTLSDGSQPRFPSLFYRARITEIPSGLFDGIHGAPVSNMFAEAFGGCNLLTSIPENLFSGIVGNAPYMFHATFSYSGLTNIPENLFSGITNGATNMFNGTFMNTPITSIPENLFSGITDTAEGMFEYTFSNCSELTGPSARINGKPLYELWPDNVATWGDGMYTNATGLSDYACIPTVMGGGGEECEPAPEYKFTATIDLSMYNDNIEGWGMPVTEFGFNLGAAGTFYVDWGDGNTETIEKDNTDAVTYTHDYGTTSGTYTVNISGLATDYSDDEYTPAISFGVDVSASSVYSQAITAIFGSLGAIFPTLSDASQPRFIDLFYQSRIRAIPSGLFDGIHGVPVSNMFLYTFDSCNYLTSIPEKLFAGITGVAAGMFEYTFSYCSGLTGPSVRINGKPLYELWPDNVAEWGAGMYDGATGLSDYACIPTDMGGGGETCEPTPEVLCTIGISQIKISTGMSFALYAEKYTQPSLAIKYNDGICYGKLEQGNQSGTMNFNYNGTVYHLAN